MSALDRPVPFFADEQSFRDRLVDNHTSVGGVWPRSAKKGSGSDLLNHAGALRQALCLGWIDGQARGENAEFWQVGFTPRRQRSPWSLRDIGLVGELKPETRARRIEKFVQRFADGQTLG
ncbi:YdeI/OmpD-associated family protein [Nocardia sp. CA-129566]|uniref:YdeI/OmpD-associated family protein n=1 Tax=Nocardia sp. CA-129566 TaxID=3239976 RepID=UPI003D9A02FE